MTLLVDARPMIDPLNGGVTRVARGLIPALIKAMPDARFVLATTGSRRPDQFFHSPFSILHSHLSIPNKLWSAACAIGLTSFDRVFSYRCHFERSEKSPFDFLFLPNIGFIGRPRLPYALLVHDVSFLIEPAWFSQKARLWHKVVHAKQLIKNATHLFAVSERTKTDVIHYLNIPADRINVVPMGLDTIAPFPDLPPQLLNRRFVLALGANDRRKNAGCAIEAVRLLRQNPKFDDVTLVMTGCPAISNEVRNLPFSMISRVARNDNINVLSLGRPSDRALATLLKNASAFLYPTWYEGFGLPLHEAAKFGTPCIASTAGALPETAPTGTRFASPSKPHLWTEALADVLDHPLQNKTQTTLGDWSAAASIIANKLS